MHTFFAGRQQHKSHTAMMAICLAFCMVLAALVCSTLFGSATQQAYADESDQAYALLYDDGTLVFQRGDTPEEGRTLSASVEVDESAVYSETNLPPWNEYGDSIIEIEFADVIKPAKSVSYYFYGLSACQSMNLDNLDCSNCHSSSTYLDDGNNVFEGCSSLVSLKLPSSFSVCDIRSLFRGCSSLVSLYFPLQLSWNAPTADNYVFEDCTSLHYLGYPYSTKWTKSCYTVSGSAMDLDLPAATGKTWYSVHNGAADLGTPLTSAFPGVSGGGSFEGYTVYYDPLLLSDCTLSASWVDDSPVYSVENGDGAKLSEDLDYELAAYSDAGCTSLVSDFDNAGVYYLRAEQVGDYAAYNGNTDVAPIMTSVYGVSDVYSLTAEAFTFNYSFGSEQGTVESSDPDIATVSATGNANEYEVSLLGIGETTITLSCDAGSVSFTITVDGEATDINTCTVVNLNDLTYLAREQYPDVAVVDASGNELPTADWDFTGFFSDEGCTQEAALKDAGTYYFKITGKRNYTGEMVASCEVAKATPTFQLYDPFSLLNDMLDSSKRLSLTYGTAWDVKANSSQNFIRYNLLSGDSAEYEIVTTADVDGIDLMYNDSDLFITPYALGPVTVSFGIVFPADGNYEDVTTDLYFDVSEASLSSADIAAALDDAAYDGKAKTPVVTVVLDGVALEEGVDYDAVYYSDAACTKEVAADALIEAGTYYVKAVGKGNYTGTTSSVASFTIGQGSSTLSVNPSEVELDVNGGSAEAAVAYAGDGEITVTSSNENIVRAQYANGVVTLTPVAAGVATVTVRASAGANYGAATAYIEVTVTGAEVVPEPDSYAIDLQVEGTGSATISTDEAYEGDTVTLTLQPGEGYETYDVVAKDASGTTIALTRSTENVYSFMMPASAVTISVVFSQTGTSDPEPESYAIDLQVEGGGSATVSTDEACEGDTVTLTLNPEDGYEPGKVAVTDAAGGEVALTLSGDGAYSFTMPASDVVVEVTFVVVEEPGIADPGDEDGSGTTSGNEYGFTVVDESNTGIGVEADLLTSITNAEGYIGSELVITPLSVGDADYDTLAAVATGELLGAYDVTLFINGQEQSAEFGTLTLTFPVGDEYEGYTVRVWHLHEGEDPVYYNKVVENGVVSVTVDRLSAFAVDVQTDDEDSGGTASSGSNGDDGGTASGTGTGSESGSGTGTVSGTGGSSDDGLTKTEGLSKTGDGTLVGVSALACIGVIALAALLCTGNRRRRKCADDCAGRSEA